MNQAPNQGNSPNPNQAMPVVEEVSLPRYRYSDLSKFGKEVLIEYEGQIYRLRTTRNGKLILNK